MLARNLLVIFAVGFLVTSCDKKKEDNYDRFTISSASLLADENLSSSEKSEALAKQAEKLLTAQGVLQSQEVVDLALQQDPKNLRARLIKALLGPVLLQQGLLSRYMNISKRDPLLHGEYLDFIKDKIQIRESAFKTFLSVGAPDFETEQQVQSHFDKMYDAFETLRVFVKEVKDQELTFKSNLDLTPDLAHRYAMACEIITTAQYEYELKCPPSDKRFEVTINRADFETIELNAAAYQAVIGLMNGYDLSDSIAIKGSYRAQRDPLARDILDHLLRNPNFGKLRKSHKLSQFKSFGLELVTGLRWAMARQDTLCPKGNPDPKNRFGMLINVGLCVPVAFEPFLKTWELSLKGKAVDFTATKNGKTVTTKIVHLAVLDQPYSDLRQLMPVTHDACGAIETVGDNTIRGTYPAGDANIMIPLGNPECRK